MSLRRLGQAAAGLLTVMTLHGCVTAPGDGLAGEWPMYRGNLAGTGYSALSQINTENVRGLTRAWTFSLRTSAESGPVGPEPSSQATPVVIGGVMYLPVVDGVVAIDPTSGGEIWRHRLEEGAPSRRGVAYWPSDGSTGARILFTAGSRLIALEAADGAPAEGFGSSGIVDMGIPYISVPLVHEDIVVVGANTPPGTSGGIGNARAFDARTGEKIWEFSSVPQPGEVGHETWEGDSWEGRLGVNAWPFYFTVDSERDLLYLPLAAPLPYPYGGDRPGDNLFGNSVVAVEVRTGTYVWHFQTIHHDLWDHDPPAPPVLFDIVEEGGTVPALGVTTKSGYLYLLNRETGEPLLGVEERPVPASQVPGERSSATQPVPVLPAALARVSYGPADLVAELDTSPEHVRACSALVQSAGELYNAGPFTPWVHRTTDGPPRTTLLFPGLVGGPNWGGVAFDPNQELLIAFSQDLGSLGWLEETGDPAAPYARQGPRPSSFDVAMGDQRWPCQKPPWGQLTAIQASTGEIAWQVPLGITRGLPPDRQNTGRPGRAGAIVTGGGLVFIAATDDDRFRALEASSGMELWVDQLDRRGNANPLTYLGADGNQYVAIAATDAVVAYRLP